MTFPALLTIGPDYKVTATSLRDMIAAGKAHKFLLLCPTTHPDAEFYVDPEAYPQEDHDKYGRSISEGCTEFLVEFWPTTDGYYVSMEATRCTSNQRRTVIQDAWWLGLRGEPTVIRTHKHTHRAPSESVFICGRVEVMGQLLDVMLRHGWHTPTYDHLPAVEIVEPMGDTPTYNVSVQLLNYFENNCLRLDREDIEANEEDWHIDALVTASKFALSALETSGDLTEQERREVIEDLAYAIDRADPPPEH